MNAKQVVHMFCLNPKFIRRDVFEHLKDFKDFDVYKAQEIMDSIVQREGPDKPRLYYIQAVRREMLLLNHQSRKQAPIAPSIKEIMRGV